MDRKLLDGVTKALMDQGRIIEAGWVAMRAACIPPNASEIQLTEMRRAFFGGAQHLFASIMSGLEDGTEATDADERRMTLIDAELRRFVTELKEATLD